jgi:glyoxylate reductase
MLLLLTLARRGEALIGTSVAEKTLGLIGFDPVAQAIARRASQGFGMRVLVHDAGGTDRVIAMQLGTYVSPSLDHLLAEADIISLHGQPSDGVTINAQRLNQMKPDACLINTISGEVVDEQALLHALWFETIGGAGVCVPQSTSPRLTQLRACESAIVLPYPDEAPAATITSSAMIAHRNSALNNVVQLFEDGQRSG